MILTVWLIIYGVALIIWLSIYRRSTARDPGVMGRARPSDMESLQRFSRPTSAESEERLSDLLLEKRFGTFGKQEDPQVQLVRAKIYLGKNVVSVGTKEGRATGVSQPVFMGLVERKIESPTHYPKVRTLN